MDDFEFPDVAFEEEEEEVEVDEADEASGKVVKLVDQVIIAAYAQVDRSEVATFRARIALVDEDNRLTDTREVGLADRG